MSNLVQARSAFTQNALCGTMKALDFHRLFGYAFLTKAGRSYIMKLLIVPLLFGVLVLLSPSVQSQIVLNFDDLSESGSGTYLGAYHGLGWSNFGIQNAILSTGIFPHVIDGVYHGMVSPSNDVNNGNGYPAEIDSLGANFNFLSAYLTAAWNDNLHIQIQGYNGTNLIYDETKVVSATSPTLFTFDYLNIDHLYFNSYGGTPPYGASAYNFVMDDFMFESVPEPSSLLLTALAAVPLIAFLRRKRT